jgi:hypothetical protein
VSLFVQGESSPLEIFSSDRTDTGEYRCTAAAVHLYSPVSVRSELNISRGDYSPCTNNDTVFSTLPALLEAVHLYSPVSVRLDRHRRIQVYSF